MREAYKGIRPKRDPILIKSRKDHTGFFDILDGNSTWHIASQIGLEMMSVILQSS